MLVKGRVGGESPSFHWSGKVFSTTFPTVLNSSASEEIQSLRKRKSSNLGQVDLYRSGVPANILVGWPTDLSWGPEPLMEPSTHHRKKNQTTPLPPSHFSWHHLTVGQVNPAFWLMLHLYPYIWDFFPPIRYQQLHIRNGFSIDLQFRHRPEIVLFDTITISC